MTQHLTSYQGDKATVAVAPRGRLSFDLMDPTAFQHIQRVAVMYANSPLFPDHLRKGGQQTAIANAVLVMNIAERLREDPLTVAQQIYFVGGKPGWAATYMIAKANQHGVFKNPIDWKVTGKKETLSVTAHAELASTGKKVEVTVDMETAKAEGWTRNSKYQSMPEQMLRYRSATALIRLYCPEVMIGVPPANEVEDQHYSMRDVTPEPEHSEAPATKTAAAAPEVEDAETIEEKPKPEKTTRKPVDRTPPKPAEAEKEPEPVVDEPKPEPDHDPETGEVTEPEAEAEPEAEEEPAPREKPKRNWADFGQTVAKDYDATGDIDAVLSFYRTDLLKMKEEAPDVFAQLQRDTGEDWDGKL